MLISRLYYIYILDGEHALGVYFECMKWSNRSKTADFRSTECVLDLELQMRFSPFETVYPRHVQDPITLAVCEIRQ